MMLVTITKRHINKGTRKSATNCPIALAINEKLNEKVDVVQSGVWKGNGWQKLFNLSKTAIKFINKFDAKGRKAVSPITIRLKDPSWMD